MPQISIIPFSDAAGVVLTSEMLSSLGLQIGDSVDVTMGDGQLILRPVVDAARRDRVEAISREVFENRRDAYRRLA